MDIITERVRIDMILFLAGLKNENIDTVNEWRKTIVWQRTATQKNGFESLAIDDDSWAREFAAAYGFDQLSEKIQNDLLKDGYCYVRLAAQASQIRTKGGIFLLSPF
jgi:hypothetical protein